MEDCIKNYLKALDYENITDEWDIFQSNNIFQLVIWLENRVIRFWELEKRQQLMVDSNSWDRSFSKYLQELGCPYEWKSINVECIYWLVAHGLSMRLNDIIDPRDVIIDDLGNALKLERNKNESSIHYLRRMHQTLMENVNKEQYTLMDFPLGFDTGDNVVNEVALVLRMMQLHDFKELQYAVNDIISTIQKSTSNPKVNYSLGKVGR